MRAPCLCTLELGQAKQENVEPFVKLLSFSSEKLRTTRDRKMFLRYSWPKTHLSGLAENLLSLYERRDFSPLTTVSKITSYPHNWWR